MKLSIKKLILIAVGLIFAIVTLVIVSFILSLKSPETNFAFGPNECPHSDLVVAVSISGQVLRNDTHDPIPDAQVEVRYIEDDPCLLVTTPPTTLVVDGNGFFEAQVSIQLYERFEMVISAEGCAPFMMEAVPGENLLELSIKLDCDL